MPIYISPPHRTTCNVSLRSQCAHWLWQSVPPVLKAPLPKGGWHGEAVTGGFLPRTHGRAHGPCPTKILRTYIGRTTLSARTPAPFRLQILCPVTEKLACPGIDNPKPGKPRRPGA